MLRGRIGNGIKAIKPGIIPTCRFTSPVMYGVQLGITGITKDSTGAVLGNCTLELFYTNDDVLVGKTMSDSNGVYTFLVGSAFPCYVVAYKTGSPDVAGTTVNTLTATII